MQILRLAFLVILVSFTGGSVKDRDLTMYEKAPPAVFQSLNDKEGVKNFIAGREFLWQHWQQQKLGYFEVTVYKKEDFNRRTFFIEQDKKGQWCVAVEEYIEYKSRIKGDNSIFNKTQKYLYYKVERLKVNEIGQPSGQYYPAEEAVQPNRYYLLFIDRDKANGKDLLL